MKKLNKGVITINAQDFSDWFKKHKELCDSDVVCDLLYIIDSSDLVKKFNISGVVVTLPSIDSKEFESYLIDNGYAKATKGMRLKGDELFPVDNIYKHYTNVLEFGN